MTNIINRLIAVLMLAVLAGCASKPQFPTLPPAQAPVTTVEQEDDAEYSITSGDHLKIFVWRNADVSVGVPVRPDGRISVPLVGDLIAKGKTASQLTKEIEEKLGKFIKEPEVTVIVTGFLGARKEDGSFFFGDGDNTSFNADQIRVIGQAQQPRVVPFREGMTVLDVVIAVGGLTEFADGNASVLVRNFDGESDKFSVRLDDLINRGDIAANIEVKGGDVLIIPEARFF